jgi:DNA-binding response OmpR family regulator
MQRFQTLNRPEEPLEEEPPLQAGNLRVEPATRRALVQGAAVPLTHQEFDLLVVLMRATGAVVSQRTICETLWGQEGRVEKKRLPVVMSHLRLKLGDAWPYTIETVRCRGYGLLRQREGVAEVRGIREPAARP